MVVQSELGGWSSGPVVVKCSRGLPLTLAGAHGNGSGVPLHQPPLKPPDHPDVKNLFSAVRGRLGEARRLRPEQEGSRRLGGWEQLAPLAGEAEIPQVNAFEGPSGHSQVLSEAIYFQGETLLIFIQLLSAPTRRGCFSASPVTTRNSSLFYRQRLPNSRDKRTFRTICRKN